MPRRRERIMGFDRLTGIEIADLADRLVEVWPEGAGPPAGDVAQAREHVDELERSVERLARVVLELREELARMESGRGGATP